MIITLLIWLLLYIESSIIGNALQGLAFGDRSNKDINLRQILLGLVAITTASSYFSLFAKIGATFAIILFLLSVSLFIIYRPNLLNLSFLKKLSIFQKVSISISFVLVLELSTHAVLNPDTNIYHAQAIRWIENFPAILGLGNLHGRFAFNSAWFLINAVYSFSFLGGQSYHLVSSFLFLVVVIALISNLSPIHKMILLSDIVRMFFLLFAFLYLASDISSPGTDTPTTLILWVLVLYLVEFLEDQNKNNLLIITILSTFAITIKLSAVSVGVLILVILVFLLAQKDYKKVAVLFLTSGIIFIPFLTRNFVLSGYLLYPFPSIDLFNVPWKVALDRVIEERNAILVWGRLPGEQISAAMKLGFTEWFPDWFAGQTLIRRALVLFASASLLPLLIQWKLRLLGRLYFAIYFLTYFGFFFWLFASPDFRFGYSFLIPTIVLTIAPIMVALLNKYFNPTQINRTFFVLLVLLLMSTLWLSFDNATFRARILQPSDYDRVKTIPCGIGNASLFCAKSYNKCSYHDFPCIPHDRFWVFMAGEVYTDGFIGIK